MRGEPLTPDLLPTTQLGRQLLAARPLIGTWSKESLADVICGIEREAAERAPRADAPAPDAERLREALARWIKEVPPHGYPLTPAEEELVDAAEDAFPSLIPAEASHNDARRDPVEALTLALRIERGWPTPNHMRRAADALDILSPALYGDVLRWFADLCDGPVAALDAERAPRADGPAPDAERHFIDWAMQVRREHDATHGEAEMCGAECIVMGLCDDADDDPDHVPQPLRSPERDAAVLGQLDALGIRFGERRA